MSTARADFRAVDQLTLQDVEAIRLILRGESVIDWQRLYFADDAAAVEFLASQGIDAAPRRPRAHRDLRAAFGKGHSRVCACTR